MVCRRWSWLLVWSSKMQELISDFLIEVRERVAKFCALPKAARRPGSPSGWPISQNFTQSKMITSARKRKTPMTLERRRVMNTVLKILKCI